MKLTTTTLKRLVLIEQKKFGAESRLRRQIREHVSRLLENDGEQPNIEATAASDKVGAKLENTPGLKNFVATNVNSAKTLAAVIDEIISYAKSDGEPLTPAIITLALSLVKKAEAQTQDKNAEAQTQDKK